MFIFKFSRKFNQLFVISVMFNLSKLRIKLDAANRVDIVRVGSPRKKSDRQKANKCKHKATFDVVFFLYCMTKYNDLIVIVFDCKFIRCS